MDSQLWIRIAVLWGVIVAGLAAHPDSRKVLVHLWESARLLNKNRWIWGVIVVGWLAGEVYLFSLWLTGKSIGGWYMGRFSTLDDFEWHLFFCITGRFLIPYASWAVILFYFILKRQIRSGFRQSNPDMVESSRLIFGTVGVFLIFGGVFICLNAFLHLWGSGSLSFQIHQESILRRITHLWWVRMREGSSGKFMFRPLLGRLWTREGYRA